MQYQSLKLQHSTLQSVHSTNHPTCSTPQCSLSTVPSPKPSITAVQLTNALCCSFPPNTAKTFVALKLMSRRKLHHGETLGICFVFCRRQETCFSASASCPQRRGSVSVMGVRYIKYVHIVDCIANLFCVVIKTFSHKYVCLLRTVR